MKRQPLKVSNQGENLDEDFFRRINSFELYFTALSVNQKDALPNLQAAIAINLDLQKPQLDNEDIRNAIKAYNKANAEPLHTGAAWLGLSLHLIRIASVFEINFELDSESFLLEMPTGLGSNAN
ncbi:MAG: hypothetical protein AB8F78_05830 [Saprospiraceae bacterium]